MTNSIVNKICIVTEIFFGSEVKNDFASSAYALAQNLASEGHNVTLVWVPAPGCQPPDSAEQDRLATWCFENYLVRLIILKGSVELYAGLQRADKVSVAVYHHLRDHEYDVAYVTVEGGLPFFAIAARDAGLPLACGKIIAVATEPTLWRLEADERFVDHKELMTICFMERLSVEKCEHLVVPVDYLREWMEEKGWKLPRSVEVLAPVVPREWFGRAHPSRDNRLGTREIVFLDGCQNRRGITEFCNTVDKLYETGVKDLTVTITGPFGQVFGEHSGGYVLRRSQRWPFRLKFLSHLDEVKAFEYVREFGATAVFTHTKAIAPLALAACVQDGIPFVARKVGGVGEIAGERNPALAPDNEAGIAAWIEVSLDRAGRRKDASKYSRPPVGRAWVSHLEDVMKPRKATATRAKKRKLPLVSIIIAHYNRPNYLRQAIQSVRELDYPNIEVVIVDDGSTVVEAKEYLDSLEAEFGKRAWKIIRQRNGYLGAARNAGIKASKGERVIFLDDDNALFPHAVTALVNAQDLTGADLCTTFARVLYEQDFVPSDWKDGIIHYFPTGGPSDIAMINNPYGDANAIFHRSVFERIGYLNEMRGLSTSDWEFFLRADLAGLKISVVPEALYWYRSDTAGMHRNAHWYRNRRPIMDVFRKQDFAGLDQFFELGIFGNVEKHEIDTNVWNLESRVSEEKFGWLTSMSPNSSEAIETLAELAARIGRPDTAIELVAHHHGPGFSKRAIEVVGQQFKRVAPEFSSELHVKQRVVEGYYRTALVSTRSGREAICYTESSPSQLYLRSHAMDISFAVLVGACPAGTTSVEGWVFLPEEVTQSGQFLIGLIAKNEPPEAMISRVLKGETKGSSGWVQLFQPKESRQVFADCGLPSENEMSILLAFKPGDEAGRGKDWASDGASDGAGDGASRGASVKPGVKTGDRDYVLGGFSSLEYQQAVGTAAVKHPRHKAPARHLPARALTRSEYQAVQLTTPHPSELPLLMLAPNDEGIFLRPHRKGPTSAVIHDIFPPFARSVLAQIEITHEDASPFEFAIALTRPGQAVSWRWDKPTNTLAFSGWIEIAEKFELRQVQASLDEVTSSPLSINLAIRLPKSSSPSPSNAFWRKLVVKWD